MKGKILNTTFIVTSSVSLTVFIYLVFLGYDEIQTAKDVVKIAFSVLFPVPLLFFIRFILIEHFIPENTDEHKLRNQRPATLLLLASIIIGLCGLQTLEWVTQKPLEDHLILAHMINSTSISSYVLNFLIYNNLRANGILSGVLLSLAIHVFFMSI